MHENFLWVLPLDLFGKPFFVSPTFYKVSVAPLVVFQLVDDGSLAHLTGEGDHLGTDLQTTCSWVESLQALLFPLVGAFFSLL